MEFTQETSTTNLWLIDLKRETLDTPAKCLWKIQVGILRLYVLMIKLLVLVLCRSGWKTFSRRTRLRKQTLILWPKKLTRRSLTASNCEQVVKWMISLANNRVSKTPTRWFQIWNLDTDHLGSHTHSQNQIASWSKPKNKNSKTDAWTSANFSQKNNQTRAGLLLF